MLDEYFSIFTEKKEQITDLLIRLLEERNEIIFSMLHGSFVREGKFKDIDIAVWVDEHRVIRDAALDYELSTSVDISYNLPYPVDVKVINYAPLGFQYYAVAGRLLTSSDDDFRVETVTAIWNRYFDFLPKSKEFLLDMIS